MDKFIKRKSDSVDCEPSKNEKLMKFSNSGGKKEKFRRLYCDSYLKFGFYWTGDTQLPIPLCVVCGQRLSNDAMVPSKLKRHLISRHPHLQNKESTYFQELLQQTVKQGKQFHKVLSVPERAQIASIEVAEIIAMNSKSHSLAESVIFPACKKMVKRMLGEEAELEIGKIPLSNNTVQRRIRDLSQYIEENVMDKLQQSQFALQVDETTDISKFAHIIAFVRFIHKDEIINQFLCCKTLPTTTRGCDIFDVLSKYLTKFCLSWKSCVGVCTDGAPSMVGRIKGFLSLVEKENPNILKTHCFLHREELVSKSLHDELREVLKQVIEMVNYIKSSSLNSRIFEVICKEMELQHIRLLLHTEVRWMSKGRVLARFNEVREELLHFFTNEKHERFVKCLKNDFWLSRLEYLTEIFSHLNLVNSSMQGRNENLLTSTDKLVAFKKKIILWKDRAKSGNTDMFPLVRKHCVKDMAQIISDHLTTLETKIQHYFPSINTDDFDWIRDPFADVHTSDLELCEKEELASLSSDRTLRIKHGQIPIDAFWITIKPEYPALAQKAVTVLLQFSTSYLCELGFSTLSNIKNKKREKLINVEEEMRVCLSHIRPDIEAISKKHQAHPSH